jgi:hypothetical protein
MCSALSFAVMERSGVHVSTQHSTARNTEIEMKVLDQVAGMRGVHLDLVSGMRVVMSV